MPYPRRSSANKTSVRLTGLFKTKRPNLFIGTSSPESTRALIDKLKEAVIAKKNLTFFLWKNDPGKGPILSLSVDLEQERQQQQRQPRKPIQDDPFDSVPSSDDDPFGDE
jgi:hypothetical protein